MRWRLLISKGAILVRNGFLRGKYALDEGGEKLGMVLVVFSFLAT